MYQLLRIFLIIVVTSSCSILGQLDIPISDYDTNSPRQVLQRQFPQWVSDEFEQIHVASAAENHYQLAAGEARIEFGEDGRKFVYANTPTAALYVINLYLRTECLTQFSWSNSSIGPGCRLPQNLGERQSLVTSSRRIRYFGNMCTFSYSFVCWQWPQWQRLIDWLALNGFNTMLLPIGQEAIWRDVFLKMGVARSSLDRYFTSEAYLAWNRMGNLKGYGGGLSDDQMDRQLALALQIIDRLRSLGIRPVLPTFSGFVPDEMEELFPTSKFKRLPRWNGFDRNNSGILTVSAADPLFGVIGARFLKLQKMVFGDDVTNLYSADPFNEVAPVSEFDTEFLKQTARAIAHTCQLGDPKCIWVLQSWSFTNDKWPKMAIKSFLSAIPIGRLLILDLYAEIKPGYSMTSSWYGHHFVWCVLHNFGGTRALRGNIQAINKGYQLALLNSKDPGKMEGGGLTMEAIDQNYVIYQFSIDRMWAEQTIGIGQWLKSYAESRYSSDQKSLHRLWNVLGQTFYSEPTDRSKRFSVFLYHRPQLNQIVRYDWFPIDRSIPTLRRVLDTVDVESGNAHLMEDVADVTRTLLEVEIGNSASLTISEGYWLEDKDRIIQGCDQILQLFDDLSQIMADYRYSTWIGDAMKMTNSSVSARDILSVWGPNGENLDYAHREWDGLIRSYYSKRWNFFCKWILDHETFDKEEYEKRIFENVELQFSRA